MPIRKDREYRSLATPLSVQEGDKLIESDHYVEGFATTFDQPYVLWEDYDGNKYYEEISSDALDDADMTDVIMQYDHSGRVFARQSNGTLALQIIKEGENKGLKIGADLSRTDLAKGLHQDIDAGMINKMSWAFTVEEESYNAKTRTRKILKIKKVYDVSAVSIPANDNTAISARSYVIGRQEEAGQELLECRKRQLILRAKL